MLDDRHIAWLFLATAAITAATLLPACEGTRPLGGVDSDAAVGDGGFGVAVPLANAGPDQMVLAGQRVTLNGTGSVGRTGGGLEYEWHQVSGLTVGLSNHSHPAPSFAAPSEPGELVFELRVSEAGTADHDVVTVKVGGLAAAEAPLASAGGDLDIPSGMMVRLDGSSSSPAAGGVLAWQWDVSAGTGLDIVDPDSREPDLNVSQGPGSGLIKLEVSENGIASAPDYATIRFGPDITLLATAPMVTASPSDEYATPGTTVGLAGTAGPGSDEFRWTQVAGDPIEISSPASAGASIVAPDRVGRFVFAFKAAKGDRWSAPAFKTVRVWAGEGFQAPVADAGNEFTAAPGSTAHLDGTRSSVDPRRAAAFRWEQTGGIAVTLSDPASAAPTFTAPKIYDTLTFQLSVSDGIIWSAPDTLVVRVGKP
ncbi:MAG: hypothetical protein HY897_07385 [Deltaproteobacteria bacterium]|nr:hypothetical protein [Deltaproteobacteria bacterium]